MLCVNSWLNQKSRTVMNRQGLTRTETVNEIVSRAPEYNNGTATQDNVLIKILCILVPLCGKKNNIISVVSVVSVVENISYSIGWDWIKKGDRQSPLQQIFLCLLWTESAVLCVICGYKFNSF